MTECTSPVGHRYNKWAIEGGAVCSLCGAKLSLSETLAMVCSHDAIKRMLDRAGIEVGAQTLISRVQVLINEIAALKEQYGLLRDAVNQNSGECSPECDSYGHADDCKHQDMAHSLELLQGKYAALQRELSGEAIEELRGQIEQRKTYTVTPDVQSQ